MTDIEYTGAQLPIYKSILWLDTIREFLDAITLNRTSQNFNKKRFAINSYER